MTFLTESLLVGKSDVFRKSGSASKEYLSESTYDAEITIFLSHSHRDKCLVEGLIELFAEQRIRLYVDWQDTNMPRITNRITAEGIKDRIKEFDKFIFLATENGLKSKWCPWELGISDLQKGKNDILVIPVVNSTNIFNGNEYLLLYNYLGISSIGKLLYNEHDLFNHIVTTASPFVSYLGK